MDHPLNTACDVLSDIIDIAIDDSFNSVNWRDVVIKVDRCAS